MKRASGVLLHITSLPSRWGIGSPGKQAEAFLDRLEKAGQTYWQILPLTPPDENGSPYASISAFAANELLIDVEKLYEYGLLEESDLSLGQFPNNGRADFDYARKVKTPLFKKAYRTFVENEMFIAEYNEFCRKNLDWVYDAAFYFAEKDKGEKDVSFRCKEKSIQGTDCDTNEKSVKCITCDGKDVLLENISCDSNTNSTEKSDSDGFDFIKVCVKGEDNTHDFTFDGVNYHIFLQFIFDKQWKELREKAHRRGIRIMGDIPMYVSPNGVDIKSTPENFRLDGNGRLSSVAGVPPDYFSEDGQLWGNPLYNWEYMRETDYYWWKRRIERCRDLYDCLRIDHFRAFDSYWVVPSVAKTAKEGHWEKGEGLDFVTLVKKYAGEMSIVAEDLGEYSEGVARLLKNTNLPGMKVLQFAFDGSGSGNAFLPHNYNENCVAYLGTHDNDTIVGWWNGLSDELRTYVYNYTGFESGYEIHRKMMKLLSRSKADTVIFTMQDVLGMDSTRRMNVPGTVSRGNWTFMLKDNEFTDGDVDYLATITALFARNPEKRENEND